MDWIDLGRAALRYDLTGSGPDTLVLIHEMGGTLDSWDQVLPILNRDRLVLRYDTRGAGQSEKLRGAITFDDMADDLAALLDALPIAGPVSLVGCAVGGAIALRFAGRIHDQCGPIEKQAVERGGDFISVSRALDRHLQRSRGNARE